MEPPPPGSVVGSRLASVPEWLSESFRLCIDQAGHLFTIIVVVSFPFDLLAAGVTWLGLRDLVVTISDDSTISADGVTPWLWMALATVVVGFFTKALVGVAAARHVLAARTGVPEPWSDTLREVGARAGRIGGALVLFGLAFFAYYLAVAAVVTAIGALVPLLGVLALFGAMFALLAFVGRFGLGPIATAVAPAGFGGIRNSARLTRGLTRPLVGRLAMLMLIGFMMILIASFFTAPFLGGEPVDLAERPLVLSDLAGSNPAGFAAGQAISSLVLAAFAALAGGAFGLLFADLGGPLDPSITDVDPDGTQPAWPDLGTP